MAIQLDLFESKEDVLFHEINEVKKQISNVRRGIFARFDKLTKEVENLRKDIAEIKNEVKQEKQMEIFEFIG